MKIRIATSADAMAIASLHTLSWRLTYKNALSAEYLQNTVPAERESVWSQRFAEPKINQCVTIAEIEDKPVGFACVFACEHAEWGSYLDNLHVSQLNQRMGVGRALLVNAAQWCDQHTPGVGMYLLVNQDNLRAQQFYLRCGARNIESVVWHAPDGNAVPTYIFAWDTIDDLDIKNKKVRLD